MDKHFKVESISKTDRPNQTVFAALHQCYSENFVWTEEFPSEHSCGDIIVKRLLNGNRGHFSPLESANIVLNYGHFPHSVMQQVRTHRHLSFSVQSFRYSGQRISDAALDSSLIDKVFYLRPVGDYKSRDGKKYYYSLEQRLDDIYYCHQAAIRYADRIEQGFSEEHARSLVPFDVRQNWIMTANARSLMHLLDMRWKADAQIECQWLCDLTWHHFSRWMPEVAEWYLDNRAKRGRLAP
jgi:thymidylate synthase (FAD)